MGARRTNHRSSAGFARATLPGGGSEGAVEAPSEELVDFARTLARPRARGLPSPTVVRAVAVAAEREWRFHLELALEAGAPLLPSLLVLELVLVEGRGLLGAVRQAELDRQVGRAPAHLVPRRAERELLGDGPDPPRADVYRERDRRQDRPRPGGRLR